MILAGWGAGDMLRVDACACEHETSINAKPIEMKENMADAMERKGYDV